MKIDVVVDIGNTRIKWGRCLRGGVSATAALPPDDPAAWRKQFSQWQLLGQVRWAIGSVQPQRGEALTRWLRDRGDMVVTIDRARQLPLQVEVPRPDWVGIDRLLDAVAVVRHERRRRLPAVVVDAGSAVTVDWVDAAGTFRGGAIFPGIRLMAQSLHDHTALLPLVEIDRPCPHVPAPATTEAMQAGVYYAVAGGINALITRLSREADALPHIYLTGGDAELLRPAVDPRVEVWPEMTLEGLRLTAEALPDES